MAELQTSLLVRHLPSVLSDQEKVDLLCHFGAKSVQIMGGHGPMKHCAFARFADIQAAERALKKLHQLEVLGCRLVVEFAKESTSYSVSESLMVKSEPNEKPDEDTKTDVQGETGHVASDEAYTRHNIPYPKKPTLFYMYPPPTVSTLTNIANALASHPKFYTQVLHLMNKMNLPCPFGAVTPSPPLALEKSEREIVKRKYADTEEIEEVEMEYASTEESEIESDSENAVITKAKDKHTENVPAIKKRQKKRLRVVQQPMPTLLKHAVTHNPSEVFEAASDVRPAHIQFNISEKDIVEQLQKSRMESEKSVQEEAAVQVVEGGFGKVEPQKKEQTLSEVNKPDVDYRIDKNLFLTMEDIVKGRLKEEQFKDFSVFKKYDPGETTSRLYIKNLTKRTAEQDLVNIFGIFIDWSQDMAAETFDVRVMKEGRMKGQAFVTLPNEEEASNIVKECNGYILNSKPIVIQFARSAKAKQVDKPVE